MIRLLTEDGMLDAMEGIAVTNFTVQVDWTDRTRDETGQFITTMHTVGVQADSPEQALCVGIQFVASTRIDGIGGMPVAARIVL